MSTTWSTAEADLVDYTATIRPNLKHPVIRLQEAAATCPTCQRGWE